MLSRGLVPAISLLRGSESRILAAPVRSLSVLNSRASLLRPGSCVVSRSMSNEETSSRAHVPTMHRVTSVDKISLVLTRTMKSPIPTEVHVSTMEQANNRRRIIVNLGLVLLTLFASIWIIRKSQKGRKEHTLVSLHERNVQRHARIKEEASAAEDTNKK